MAEKSLPKINPIDQGFWQGTAEGKLLLQKCVSCNHLQFFPRPVCTRCFHSDLQWISASGRGTIHSFTWVRVPRNPAFKEEAPICYADIVLKEGVLMQSRVMVTDVDGVNIGAPVLATFIETHDPKINLPVFELINP